MPEKKEIKYSFTRVDCYEQCPFKYLLKYIDSNYVSISAIALDVGTTIHDNEEKIANAIKNGEPIDYVKLKNDLIVKMAALEKKFPKDWNEPDKVNRYYKEKFFSYLTSGIYRLEKYCKDHPELEIVGAEIPFKTTICGKLFGGKIDRLFRNKVTGEYLCQDIKTYPTEVEEEHLTTPLQFVVYTAAIKEMYNVTTDEVKCQFDLPFCEISQDAGTNGFMNRGLKKIEKLFEGIDNQEFKPKPSRLCYWCEYSATKPDNPKCNHLCPYYMLWTKDQPKNFSVNEKWESLEAYRKKLEETAEKTV